MADAKKCDICGKFYDYYEDVELDDGTIIPGCKIQFRTKYDELCDGYDFCRDCMTKVHTLLSDIYARREKRNV